MKNADSICKYTVLILFTLYIGFCVYRFVDAVEAMNMPDWIVSLFTMVFLYFFRRSPKKEVKDGTDPVV